MSRPMTCDDVRSELSAELDGEADANLQGAVSGHLAICPECRARDIELKRARNSLRLQGADEVPDLTSSIMERVRNEGVRARRRDSLRSGLRIGGVAAAVAALVVVASSLPFSQRQPSSAHAAEIVRDVRSAAGTLTRYHATFRMTERNFSREVRARRFSAEVWFEAPERFRLQVRDLTTYPGEGWPANNVDLIAHGRRWWMRAPSTCPAEVSGSCPYYDVEVQSAFARQPFDGTSSVPTDIVVPLETVAASRDFAVRGPRTIAGHPALGITMPYRQALPLVKSLQAGGAWRDFHPLDRVEMWIDAETYFPLRFDVMAAEESERARWARGRRYPDRAGQTVLSVRATSFTEPEFRPSLFGAPADPGSARDGGFTDVDPAAAHSWIAPTYTAGLSPYRAGTTANGRRILAYERGMTWLKVTSGKKGDPYPTAAEEIRLANGGYAYYQPASELFKRRIDVLGRKTRLRLESNLSRAELRRVASSIPIAGTRLPPAIKRGPVSVVRLEPSIAADRFAFARTPTALPPGYEPRAALLSRSRSGGRTLTVYYRGRETEYFGDGIRLTQSPSIEGLDPTSEDSFGVRLGLVVARWFPGRGELEWISGGVYRSVTTSFADLRTAVRIAESLE